MQKETRAHIIETPDQFIDRVLDPDYIAGLMDDLGHEIRGGFFHPAMTAWLMMHQRLSGKSSLSDAIESFQEGVGGVLNERCRGEYKKVSTSTGGYSQARTNLPEEAVNAMVDTLNEAIIGSHEESRWNGRHVYAIDGTDFRLLAQGEVKKAFPPCRNKKSESPWSTIRSVVATHMVTGIALRAANGPMYGRKAVGEVSLSKQVISKLPAHSIVLADKGLGTFSIAFTAIKRGHDVVLRLTEVRAKQALGGKIMKSDGELPCRWQPGKSTQHGHPEIPQDAELSGRIIRVTFRQPGFKPEVLFFFTTLTLPVDQIASLYALRWNVEIDFRTLKTSMKMELLDVQSASMAKKEIALGFAAYNLVRHLLAYAAHLANIAPRRISFSRYAYRVRLIGEKLAWTTDPQRREELLARLTDQRALLQIKHPNRRNRRPSRPRKVLRQPESFPFWNTKSRKKYAKTKQVS